MTNGGNQKGKGPARGRSRSPARNKARGQSQSPRRGRSPAPQQKKGRSKSPARQGRGRSLSFDTKNNNKTVTTKVQSKGKKVVPRGGININGDHFTLKEAQKIWQEAGKPPERTTYLTAQNNMVIKSTAQRCLWQNVFTAIILADQAKAPNLRAPVINGDVSWSGLVAYYWWAMISKFQEQGVGVLQNDTSAPLNAFRTTVVPAFPDKNRLPTGVLKFIETFMPSYDKDTKSSIQYKYVWTGVPAFTTSHLSPANGPGDFGYCPYGNFYCISDPAVLGGEISFGKSTGTALVIDDVYERAEQFDRYVTMTTAQGMYCDIPPTCSMATVQARVMVGTANRKIVSSSQNIDTELACIFFGNFQGDNLSSPYRYERPIPIVDTGIDNQFIGDPETEFLAMTLNYGFITCSSAYVRGGLRNLLAMNKTYEHLKTLQPKFFNLDMAQYHRHLDDAWIMVAQGALPPEEFYCALVVWESAILSRMMYAGYMGNVLFSADNTGNAEIIDLASTTFVSGVFRTTQLPPAVALVLAQLGEIVTDGQLMVPLWDFTSPLPPVKYVGIAGGGGNAGLPTGVTQWSGRWVGISSLTAAVPNGNYNTYALSTPTVIPAPPGVVYLANVGPYQFSSSISTPQVFEILDNPITNTALGTNLTIASPAYPPMTPVKLATNFLSQYNSTFNKLNSNFLVPEDTENADHCEFNAIVRTVAQDNFPMVGHTGRGGPLKNLDGFSGQSTKRAVIAQRVVKVHPTEVGSYIRMDGPQATKTLTTGFRVVSDLDFMPFKLMNKQDGDITLQMNQHSLVTGSPTIFQTQFASAQARGEHNNMALETAFAPFMKEYYEHGTVGPAISHKAAVLLIMESMHGIVVGPYRQRESTSITSAESWSDISKFFTGAWSFTKHYILPVAKVAGPVILGFL